MGFTTPCFIRKNTLKLQEKLKNIGYLSLDNDNDKRDGLVADRNGFMYSILEKNLISSTYNCGTNEGLFLAIAALRDDTDKNQWFVLDYDNIWEAVGCYQHKGDFILCNHDRWYCGTDVAQAHKATVKELQELFSPKIQVPQIEWNINDVINKD
jgi:hypothetical protein